MGAGASGGGSPSPSPTVNKKSVDLETSSSSGRQGAGTSATVLSSSLTVRSHLQLNTESNNKQTLTPYSKSRKPPKSKAINGTAIPVGCKDGKSTSVIKSNTREVTVVKRNDTLLHNSVSVSELDSELTSYATRRLCVDRMPPVDTLTAPKLCSSRLNHIIDLLENGAVVDRQDMVANLRYSIAVLDTLYIEETKRLFDDDDALNEVEPDAVPSEVREWLAQTFTRSQSVARVRGERPKFKSVAHVVRAGLMVDRIYRRMSSFSEPVMQVPPAVAIALRDVDQWNFDVFNLNEKSEGNALRYMGRELLRNQGIINKYRMNVLHLDNFLLALQSGYSKYGNPYHNLIHGADVAQTTYALLQVSGILKWLTNIEIFATIIAALIHDYEHTGTTNNFHIMTSTPLALLYNDKAVLENHHVCAAFELMRMDDKNILIGLKSDEYREFRALVIDMVLATDMSGHFQQIKNMKSMLSCAENIDKSKALCLILHTADIGHPSKPWPIHKKWTDQLIEEFFKQGDREKELGIPCSPLCDRQTTLVEKSQIGFIDFIVEPSFNVLGDMMETIIELLHKADSNEMKEVSPSASVEKISEETVINSNADHSVSAPPTGINRCWAEHLTDNRMMWKQLAGVEDDEDSDSSDNNNNTNDTNDHTSKGRVSRSTSTSELLADTDEAMTLRPPHNIHSSSISVKTCSRQTSTSGIIPPASSD